MDGMDTTKTIIIVLVFYLCGVLLSGFAFAQSGDQAGSHAFSLNDIYRLALDKSEAIKIAQESLQIAELDKERAMAVLYPRLSTFALHKEYSEDNSVQPNNASSIGAKIDRSFTLNGKELIALRIAKQLIEKSGYDLKTAQADYLFEITSAYFSTLKAQKTVEIAQADIFRKETHKNAVTVRLQLKTVPKTELYRTEAELSASHTELLRAENALNLSRTVLIRNLDLPRDFTLDDSSGLMDAPKAVLNERSPEQLKSTALEKRSEMKALRLANEVSKKEVQLAKSAHWPQVSLEAGYTYTDGSPDYFYPENEVLYGQVMLNFPIFEGGLRNAEIRQAQAAQRQVSLNRNAVAKKISIEVEQAALLLKNQQSLIKSLNDQLKFSQENYEAVSHQYNYGMANSIDVMDANTLLVTTERQLAEVRFDLQLAKYRLLRAQGTFLQKIMENIENAK